MFAKKAKELSDGKVIERFADVTKTVQKENGKWITTQTKENETYEIESDFVVNAAGLWANKLGSDNDIFTPSVVLQHQYVIFESIPELNKIQKERKSQLPVLRDMAGSY